ncbi:MAG: hypothetical protein V4747_11340 [Pseudomonadota bacterium]
MTVTTFATTLIFAAYDEACRKARFITPSGHLTEEDLGGIRKRIARDFKITPEDLARWIEARHV